LKAKNLLFFLLQNVKKERTKVEIHIHNLAF
jgi:hypothetical protein